MKPKPITVEEIKQKEPLAEVYEFKKWNRYLIIVKQSRLVGAGGLNKEALKGMAHWLAECGVSAMFLVADSDDIKILELKSGD